MRKFSLVRRRPAGQQHQRRQQQGRQTGKTVTRKEASRQQRQKQARHQQKQLRQQIQAIIMSDRFVCASASTGAPFYSNVTPIYSTGRGRPIPYRVETPSNSVGLAECSDRFLHKKNLPGDSIASERLAPSTSLAPTGGISHQLTSASISCSSRDQPRHVTLPAFWDSDTDLWFKAIENIFSLHGTTDERNCFELALGSLDLRHMQKNSTRAPRPTS